MPKERRKSKESAHTITVHSVLRKIKMFKKSYIVVNNVEIRLVCVHIRKKAF